MNGQAITADDLLSEIKVMETALNGLKKKVLSLLPPTYGSDAWWEKGEKKVDDELRRGKGKTFTSESNFLHYMKTLT